MLWNRLAEERNHRGVRTQRAEKLLPRRGRDYLDTHHTNRVIVHIARRPRHHDFILEPGEHWQPLHLFRIAAGYAGRRGMRQRSRASRRDDAPFRLSQLGQAPAYAVHELIEMDVMP